MNSLLRVRERTVPSVMPVSISARWAPRCSTARDDRLTVRVWYEALGFPKPVDNAFDATSLAPVDMPLEIASCLGSTAVRIGSMINDLMVQYAQPRPWILLQEGGDNTYVSSAMPQKRNPGLMNNCREDCSDVIGEMNAAFLRAHNVMPGMIDGKRVEKNARMMSTTMTMLKRFRKVLAGLTINPERALEELNNDWTVLSGDCRPSDARPRYAVSHRAPCRKPHGEFCPSQQHSAPPFRLCGHAAHLSRGNCRRVP